MPLYTVLAPPPVTETAEPDPVRYVFVKDGFCWPCLFYPEIWLLFRRLWLVLLIYLVVIAIAVAIGAQVGGPIPGIFLVFAHLFFALQANAFRRWTLERRGYRMVGVAEGRRVAEAEIRFFHGRETMPLDPRQPPPSRLRAVISAMPRPSAESGEVVGLFPAPGRTP